MNRSMLSAGLVALLAGCPAVHVKQVANSYGSDGVSTDDLDGVRFYRPALHVWITRVAPSKDVDITEQTTTDVTGADKGLGADEKQTTKVVREVVSTQRGWQAQFVYLPDYSQEYVIQARPRGGIAKVSATLADGWNLTALSIEADAQVDETLAAALSPVGDIATAAAGALAAKGNFDGPGLYKVDIATDGKLSLGDRVLALGEL